LFDCLCVFVCTWCHMLCLCVHGAKRRAPTLLGALLATGWHRIIGCLVFIGHFLQKSPITSGYFAKNDLQLKASYGFSAPCMSMFVRPSACVCVRVSICVCLFVYMCFCVCVCVCMVPNSVHQCCSLHYTLRLFSFYPAYVCMCACIGVRAFVCLCICVRMVPNAVHLCCSLHYPLRLSLLDLECV